MAFVLFEETTYLIFSSYVLFAHMTPNNACFSDFCDVSAVN